MDSPATHDDVEERFNAALAGLKDEFLSAHEDLALQMQGANQRLNSLLAMFNGGRLSVGAQAAGAETEKLRHLLSERELALSSAVKHGTELEAAVAEQKCDIQQLRSRESWLVAANQDLSERLVVLRAEEKTNAKVLAKAAEEVERLTDLVAEKERALENLGKQLEHARRSCDEARQTARRLTREVAGLRRENVRLSEALQEADSLACVRDRQQRILMEALVSNGHVRRMGEILISADVISSDHLVDALGEQEFSAETMVGEILLNKGHVEEEDVAQTVACQLHLPLVQLCEGNVQREAARIVDDILCTAHRCIPIRITEDKVFVAMANPRDAHAISAIEQASGRRVVTVVATPSDVDAAIRRVFCR